MNHSLVFKTAANNVVMRLLDELQRNNSIKYCLIQSSAKEVLQGKYTDINFIDIKQEGFYNIKKSILQPILQIKFERIYIPTTGVRANNFGNIIDLCNQLQYKELVFYNCNGEISIVKRKSAFMEWLIRVYIRLIEISYRK